MRLVLLVSTAIALTNTVHASVTKSCKTRSGAHDTLVFNEDVTTITMNDNTELLSATAVCREPVSQDCATNSLKDSRIHVRNVHCKESDSHAEFIYSLVNGNGRFECRNGRTQKLVEFYDCE